MNSAIVLLFMNFLVENIVFLHKEIFVGFIFPLLYSSMQQNRKQRVKTHLRINDSLMKAYSRKEKYEADSNIHHVKYYLNPRDEMFQLATVHITYRYCCSLKEGSQTSIPLLVTPVTFCWVSSCRNVLQQINRGLILKESQHKEDIP